MQWYFCQPFLYLITNTRCESYTLKVSVIGISRYSCSKLEDLGLKEKSRFMEDLEDVNHNYTTKTSEYTFSGILKAPLIFSHFNPAINHSTNLSQGDEKRRIFL